MSAARSAYDDWHREHPTGAGLWYELARRVLRDHLAGMSVLEIGCGGGSFSAWMAAEGATRVVGADFSPTAIASAQAEFRADNLEFDMTDITAMDYLGETFDIVVSCETLEHVPSPQAAVRELARVLRPNGLLVLSVPNYLSITGAHRMFWKVTGRR
ncbi:MAG: methyltransferase domain-containing protein [Solirubrobacteraceae bacterium]